MSGNDEKRKVPLPQKVFGALVYVSQIVWIILSPIVLCLGIGYAVGSRYGNSKIWTLGGILIGVVCSVRNMFVFGRRYIRELEERRKREKDDRH
ncbi:MAG: AtpZ/AtpI family protein [Eubacteriaceae bacterium]|nr:AtpZ/AtpI family protein [Eubacteriaceae bacterium]